MMTYPCDVELLWQHSDPPPDETAAETVATASADEAGEDEAEQEVLEEEVEVLEVHTLHACLCTFSMTVNTAQQPAPGSN